jgi:general secretion pathway protein C
MLVNHFAINQAQSMITQLSANNAPKSKIARKKVRTKTKKWAQKISQRNLFNANPPRPEDLQGDQDADQEAEEKRDRGQLPLPYEECDDSELKVTVQVTMVAEPVEASYAMITVENENRIYRVGDTIEGQEIAAIQWSGRGQRVVMSNQGKFECVVLGKKSKKRKGYTPPKRKNKRKNRNNKFKDHIKEVSPGRFEVDRAMLDEQLEDLDNLVRQARVIPHYKRGKPSGFKVVGIRSNSLFRHLGLKTGDVLKSVGGEELTSINKAFSLFEKLKTSDNLSLDFERQGKVNSHEYNIQ